MAGTKDNASDCAPDFGSRPNAEVVNDRVKLLFHRLVARRLGQDPSLIILCREELARVRREREWRTYMDEWEDLLQLDVTTLRRVITRRDQDMTRLRASSPMGVIINVRDPDLRRRLWRSSRDTLMRQLARQYLARQSRA